MFSCSLPIKYSAVIRARTHTHTHYIYIYMCVYMCVCALSHKYIFSDTKICYTNKIYPFIFG